MSVKFLSHSLFLFHSLLALGVAGPIPALAFGVGIDPLPTLTFPPKLDSGSNTGTCDGPASGCTTATGR